MTRKLPKEMIPFQYVSTKYETDRLRAETLKRMKSGEDPTEIAKWLMMEENVLLYSAMKFIREAKKRLKTTI